jgi:hypothetical protein
MKSEMRILRSVALLVSAVCCASAELHAAARPRVVHVFVALADNAHQGIVPVPATLGNGEDPGRNLYWGAAFGVRTFLRKSAEWKEIAIVANPSPLIAERAIFRHRASGTILVADAYFGREIMQTIADFLHAANGLGAETLLYEAPLDGAALRISSAADLVVYVGHDGLMDFSSGQPIPFQPGAKPGAIILACASKQYFAAALKLTGSQPVLWTTNLMAPEAYTLKAALEGWILGEPAEKIRQRAGAAYAQYQKIGMTAALRLFSSSW